MNIIPQNLITEGEKYFSAMQIVQAKKVLESARINISFQKGSPERFFIISGIVNDGETREAKTSFKKNDEYPDGLLSTTCTCQNHTAETHCPHTAALFFKFQLNQI